MFKNKTLVLALATIVQFSLGFKAVSEEKLLYRPEAEIKHAIGVYITPRGQDKIFHNVPELMERNGLSVSQAYFHKQLFTMDKKPLEDILPKEGALREAGLKIRESIQRFLLGLEFNEHQFEIDLEGIEIDIQWEDVRIVLDEQQKQQGKLKLDLVFVAKGIDIGIGKLRAQDLGNDILGQVGLDDFRLFLEDGSVPLRVEVPLELENTFSDKGPSLKIGNIRSNIDEALIMAELNGDIILPQIEIHINGRVIKANYSEIENMLKSNEERIVQSIKTSLHGWLSEDSAEILNGYFVGRNEEGLFSDVNVMSPAGAPVDQIVSPFEWGIKLKKYDFMGDNLHLQLDGYFKDQVKGSTAFLPNFAAHGEPQVRNFPNNDFVLSINEGFINRIVQLSYNRGYFNSFDTEDGETYKISKMPHFKLKKTAKGSTPRLSVELEYEVTGIGASLVKNPIRINFDMFLAFPVEQGKVKIIATEIDMDSVHVDKKYIREFLGLMSWSGVVMPQVRKRFKAAQNDVRGMVLADEFPIPESMVGMPLDVVDTTLDDRGHLMIHIDTNLN